VSRLYDLGGSDRDLRTLVRFCRDETVKCRFASLGLATVLGGPHPAVAATALLIQCV